MKFQSYGAAGVLSVCLLSAPAFAYPQGITGYSGKSAETTCNKCHYTVPPGGPAPTVEITGPTSLSAGSTGQYTLTIRGGPAVKGGLNVAVDNTAASLQAGADMSKANNELIHSKPKDFSNGEVRFDFSMVAPPDAGSVKIFGAGNSVNGDGDLGGDLSATTTLSVTITGSGEEEEAGGCSSTGGAPVLLFSLLAGSMTLLRRRRS